MKKVKTTLKKILPGCVRRYGSGLFYGWHGNFSSWSDALAKSGGYSSEEIIERVRISASIVKNGSAVYERDSVLFYKAEFSFPLLCGLMWIAAQNQGKLNVLDFGGSLGSTYFKNKAFLDTLPDLNWCIVEQPAFVEIGVKNFANEKLHFFNSIQECIKSFDIEVVLLSSVLQYLEKPFTLLDQINSSGIKFIIIDRTPFIKGNDRITLQKVPPTIYRGSYPCWFFNERKFICWFSQGYNLVSEFDAFDKANIRSKFKGFIFQLKTNSSTEKQDV
jgi:putative methyltransferase (TIGR04325 family)